MLNKLIKIENIIEVLKNSIKYLKVIVYPF